MAKKVKDLFNLAGGTQEDKIPTLHMSFNKAINPTGSNEVLNGLFTNPANSDKNKQKGKESSSYLVGKMVGGNTNATKNIASNFKNTIFERMKGVSNQSEDAVMDLGHKLLEQAIGFDKQGKIVINKGWKPNEVKDLFLGVASIKQSMNYNRGVENRRNQAEANKKAMAEQKAKEKEENKKLKLEKQKNAEKTKSMKAVIGYAGKAISGIGEGFLLGRSIRGK